MGDYKEDEIVLSEEEPEIMTVYFKDFICMLVAAILVITFLFRVVVVSGPSMNSTLLHGDSLILLNNLLYRNPEAGDVVVISKKSFDNGQPIIKRIIATEGQVVDIDFEKGIVYVDGEALDEPYVNTPTNLYEGVRFPLTVDEGCVFVLGDNRNRSKDSRNPDVGQIDCREIVGKAIFILFPGKGQNGGTRAFDRIGVIS